MTPAAQPGTPRAGSTAPEATPDTVSALDRGLALLGCFTAEQRVLNPSELARATGIPRPSVIRLCATLVAHRWLQPVGPGEGYRLGAGVVSLAQVFLSGVDLRASARGPMQALAELTGGSVYLAVRDGLDMVLIEACRPRQTLVHTRLDIGSRAPLPNSALGRAYLGAAPAAVREGLLARLRDTHGAGWPELERGLLTALDEQARLGWCVSAGEFHREINSVSVALRGADGEVVAFNCGGPAFVFDERRLRQSVAPALLAMVRRVADDTGGQAALPLRS